MNVIAIYRNTTNTVESWAPSILSLALRCWLASIFFKSGLTKIAGWDSTLALFEAEYQVPVLSPVLAAYMATGIELIVPVLLVMGLFTRMSATVLCVLNAVAAISYPDISEAGMKEHVYWGILLTVPMAIGGARISADYLWLSLSARRARHVA